jgi:uncharacterized protein
MKRLWTIAFLLIGYQLNAQDFNFDLSLMRAQQINSSSSISKKAKKNTTLLSTLSSLPLDLYQKQISRQWGHTCYFEIPCSDFSGQLIQQYGAVKGFFLTIDRFGKCNKLSLSETLPSRINDKGKIIDSVTFYR